MSMSIDEAIDILRHIAGSYGDVSKYHNAISIAIAALERDRWISVEERLPEDNEAVNIVWINRSPVIYYQDIKDKPQSATGVYYLGQWYWWSAVVQDYLAEYGKWDCDKMDDAIEVTHWRALPEPPKEDKP